MVADGSIDWAVGRGRGILHGEASPLVTLALSLAAPEDVIVDALLHWTKVRAEVEPYRAMGAGGGCLSNTDLFLMEPNIWPDGDRGDLHQTPRPQRGPTQKQGQDDQCRPNERACATLHPRKQTNRGSIHDLRCGLRREP